MPKENNPVADWLNQKWMFWERERGIRATQRELAEFLGIDAPILNQYLNGKRSPTGENLEKIASKFGPEIYILLGLIPPELQSLLELYVKLTPDHRQEFVKAFGNFLINQGFERVG